MKLICAPMATLSHPAFRILIEKFGGCDEYYTEMINAPSLLNGGQFEKYYIDPAPVPNKIVWQLTGKTSDSIIKVSSILANTECIGIDLNMGCCAPDIVNSGAGIAWMLKPIKETQELVSGVKKVLDEYENEYIDLVMPVLGKIAIEMKNEEGPEDFIIYKANSILEEIYLRTQLKILMAKNDLITNLQDYYEDNLEVEEFEEDIAGLKEKTDHLIGTLEGKIATEKEELKDKYGSG